MYPEEYRDIHFCPMCHQHYNFGMHRNRGHCNDFKINGGCNHKNFCLVKKITLKCGHHVCWRCRVDWKSANPPPNGRGCFTCNVNYQDDSITRMPRPKFLRRNKKYKEVVCGPANALPPPKENDYYSGAGSSQYSSENSTDTDDDNL